MRYDFECGACGVRVEHSCLMADRPASLPCNCGGTMEQVFLSVPESFMKFRPYEFNRAKNVRSNGRMHGRTDAQQHEAYRNAFDTQRKLVEQQRRSCSRSDGVEYLGGMPGEMADSIAEHEGDKELVAKDPITLLKKTGLYMGRD